MINNIEAFFDGKVFLPTQSINLKPNSHVRLIIENLSSSEDEFMSFLDTAESLNLEGPSDWSENIDKYLDECDEQNNNES